METRIAIVALTLTPLILTVVIHYEALSLLSRALQTLRTPPHPKLLLALFGIIMAHLIEITLYAVSYWMADFVLNIGDFGGNRAVTFADYVFFSAETYSTVGMGDVYPLGSLRLISSIVLIGWSTSFTFLVMSRYWSGDAGSQ
jgi:hypothetical protein